MVFKWRDNFTEEFLDHYKSYDFLWNNSNPLYKNRVAREAAYEEIIQKLNLPHLTVRDVKNKIKTIRTNYKYELNKVLSSEKHAVNSSEIYIPHLFWFKKADEFLREFSKGREFSKVEYSEDETTCIQSEDKNQYKLEHEELDIKLEKPPSQEEENTLGTVHSDNYSSSPSPPAAKIARIDDETSNTTPNDINETHLKSTVTIPKNPSHQFKTPPSVHKMTGRPFRKYNMINSIRTRQFLQIEEKINSLQRSVDLLKNNEDDEFDLFGKSIALQLKKMPLERALNCQENLQKVINQERLNQKDYQRKRPS